MPAVRLNIKSMCARFQWCIFILLPFLAFPHTSALADSDLVYDGILIKYKSANRYINHGETLRHNGRYREVLRHGDGKTRPDSRFRDDGKSLWKKIEEIQRDKNVLYAEPNYIGRLDGNFQSVDGIQVDSPQWWLAAVADKPLLALGRGLGVIVAVIDTGVDLTHPGLQGNLLPYGYNFGDGNTIPQDELGHGTMVAGIIAGAVNAKLGVGSLAPEAKILPIKINEGARTAFTSDRLASAIDYAVSHGAKVINLSVSVQNQTQTVRESIQNALDQGLIVVASAGNGHAPVEFPANMPGVIGVAAVDKNNQLASFSNFGPQASVAAPGVDIFTTMLGHGYGSGTGTSFASAIVAAAIADLISINRTLPSNAFTPYLLDHAIVIAGGSYSFGSLNAGASGGGMTPHLYVSKARFSQFDDIEVKYDLPRTGAAVDIYVAVQTPWGEFSLNSDGTWLTVTAGQYWPIALNYKNDSASEGVLFGRNGIFSPINLGDFPRGIYIWRTAIVLPAERRIVGGISELVMQLD